jgi:HPt (histidine-containing phosphotransfer) domain-containing protein
MAVDRGIIENLREFQEDGEPDFLKELFKVFVSSTPQALELSERAIQDGDLKAAGRVLVPLRSQSGSLGAKRLMTLCTEADLLSRQTAASSDHFAKLLEKIKKEYSEVERELKLILFS